MNSQIAQLRSFNRAVTRRIGVLHDRFLGRNRPLGESRLLFEIGANGLEVRELRARLGLDSGYVSRLLRSLERQRLIETVAAPGDARVRYVRLTRKGLAEREELDRRSDDAAQSLLAPLGEKQRHRLIAAMAEVERLLRISEVTIAPEPADGAAADWCLRQYLALLNQRFEGGYDPANAQPTDPIDFSPPGGVFLIARASGQPVGCGALRSCGPNDGGKRIGEIKRVWVDESARGLGIGQKLLTALETRARGLGLNTLRLDTNKSLTEAQALYEKNGYAEVQPFNDDPYPDHWFEKKLV